MTVALFSSLRSQRTAPRAMLRSCALARVGYYRARDCSIHHRSISLRATIDYGSVGSERDPGGIIRRVMNSECAFDHAFASRFVSKNRSTTMALSWFAVRPHRRAALRLITADPVSTAVQARSGKTTLLPYGIRFGSTAQWPGRRRLPVLAYKPEAPSFAQ